MDTFCISLLLPAILVTLVFLTWRFLFLRSACPIGVTLALAVGFTVSDVTARGFIDWWPWDLSRRLPWLILLVLAVVIWETGASRMLSERRRGLVCWAVRAIVCGLVGFFLARYLSRVVDASPSWWLLVAVGFGVLLLAEWHLLEGPMRGAVSRLLALAGVAVLGGGVVALSGWPGLGQACVALGACLGTMAGWSWKFGDAALPGPATGVFTLVYSSLLVLACGFGTLPPVMAGLLLSAPLGVWVVGSSGSTMLIGGAVAISGALLGGALLGSLDLGWREQRDFEGSRDLCYVALQAESRIAILRADSRSGNLLLQGRVTTPGRPITLIADPTRQILFVGCREPHFLSSYRLDSQGNLTHLSTVPSSAGPSFLCVDQAGRFLLCACYDSGVLTVHGIDPEGGLTREPLQRLRTGEHPHAIQLDREDRFAFAPHTTAEGIFQFRFNTSTGMLEPGQVSILRTPAEACPRHLVFHPTKDLAYVNNEGDSTVTAYTLDRKLGSLRALQTASALPQGYRGYNAVAEIRLHPSGRFLYVSNRGHESLALFRIAPEDGRLTSAGFFRTDSLPWSFDLDRQGQFLHCAGMHWGRLTTYRIHPEDGSLTLVGIREVGKEPRCVLTLRLP